MINQCLTLLIKMQGFGRFKQMETLYFAGFAMVIFQTWFWRFWWFFFGPLISWNMFCTIGVTVKTN